MTCLVFFGILAICVGFCFASDSIPIKNTTESPTNGTSGVLNAANQELVADQNGTEHIFDASIKGSLAGVKYWYKQDPSSIHRKDADGWTPLHFASLQGYLSIVEFLLSKGAEVDPVESLAKTTPLNQASFGGYVRVVEVLLDKGANVNHQPINKFTALHFAVGVNKLPVVKVLLNRGADKSIRDIDNRTPLDYAKEKGYKAIEDYLSSH